MQSSSVSLHHIAQDNVHITVKVTQRRGPAIIVSECKNRKSDILSVAADSENTAGPGISLFCLQLWKRGIYVRLCHGFIFQPGITLFGMCEGEL